MSYASTMRMGYVRLRNDSRINLSLDLTLYTLYKMEPSPSIWSVFYGRGGRSREDLPEKEIFTVRKKKLINECALLDHCCALPVPTT